MIPSESIAVVRGRLPFSSITFRRGACFGTCPVYEVTLYRDGRATYSGTRFVARIGHFTGEVHLFDFARLCYLVERQRLDTLAGRYAASWTDAATTTITLSRANNTSIVIEDYGEVAPIEVWGVQQAIDAIAAGVRWSQAPTR